MIFRITASCLTLEVAFAFFDEVNREKGRVRFLGETVDPGEELQFS
jgi:hypothetical protein